MINVAPTPETYHSVSAKVYNSYSLRRNTSLVQIGCRWLFPLQEQAQQGGATGKTNRYSPPLGVVLAKPVGVEQALCFSLAM